MTGCFKARYIALTTAGIVALVAAFSCYRFLASFMPSTAQIGAIAFLVLTALASICVYRVTRWKTLGSCRRVYAAITLAISSSLLLGFAVLLAQDEMLAPKYLWAVWNIKKLGGSFQVEELRGQNVWIMLDGPQVTDAGLAYIEAFPRLRSLRLMNTKITDAGLRPLGSLSRIYFLHLDFNDVTDDGLRYLGGLADLRELRLSWTKVGDAGLERIKGLTKLCQLHLERTQVTDRGLAYLAAMSSLRQLDLDGTLVTNAGMPHLAALTKLEYLGLTGTQVTDSGLMHLAALTQLKSLNLQGTKVTDEGVKKFRQALTSCDVHR